MIFNINTIAKVTLTRHGAMIFNHYWRASGVAEKHCPETATTGTVIELELWHIMRIFGHAMFNGAPDVPFVENKIELQEKKEL